MNRAVLLGVVVVAAVGLGLAAHLVTLSVPDAPTDPQIAGTAAGASPLDDAPALPVVAVVAAVTAAVWYRRP